MSMAGAVVSSIVNVAVVLLLLPQSSVAVKVTVAMPSHPVTTQCREVIAPSHVAASVRGIAPPLLASHASRSALLPEPSHSTVASGSHVDGWGHGVFNRKYRLLLLRSHPWP